MDKGIVRMMSIIHLIGFADTGKKSRQGDPKPLVLQGNNKTKVGIDVSDQMSSYNSAVRKTMLYKAAEEMLLGTTVVNAWIVDEENAGRSTMKQYSITTFKEKLVNDLLNVKDDNRIKLIIVYCLYIVYCLLTTWSLQSVRSPLPG